MLAALGPYAVPYAVGAGVRTVVDKRQSMTDALKAITDQVLAQSPLPTEGWQIEGLKDPRQWLTRLVPRGLTTLTDPKQFEQPGVLDPLIARIPGLNAALLRRAKRRRPRR
jgi:hypothetical protein